MNALPDRLVVFEHCQIRRIFHKGEWFFSILDIIRILTDSANPSRYWSELKAHLVHNEGVAQLFGKIEQLKCRFFVRPRAKLMLSGLRKILIMSELRSCTKKSYNWAFVEDPGFLRASYGLKSCLTTGLSSSIAPKPQPIYRTQDTLGLKPNNSALPREIS